MNYLACERETIIRYDNETDIAVVNTFNRAMQKKLETMARRHPKEVSIKKTYEDGDGIIVEIPKEWVCIKAPKQLSKKEIARRNKLIETAKDRGFKNAQ